MAIIGNNRKYKWDFESVVPRLAEGEDFNELCLYAKWI